MSALILPFNRIRTCNWTWSMRVHIIVEPATSALMMRRDPYCAFSNDRYRAFALHSRDRRDVVISVIRGVTLIGLALSGVGATWLHVALDWLRSAA